jgi:hypothetical protein
MAPSFRYGDRRNRNMDEGGRGGTEGDVLWMGNASWKGSVSSSSSEVKSNGMDSSSSGTRIRAVSGPVGSILGDEEFEPKEVDWRGLESSMLPGV